MANKELLTFDDFRSARLGDTGFIVIMGSARPTIVHKLNGRCVSGESFKTKVMLGESAQGKYYWADTVRSAMMELGATPCKVCRPHLPEKDAKPSR